MTGRTKGWAGLALAALFAAACTGSAQETEQSLARVTGSIADSKSSMPVVQGLFCAGIPRLPSGYLACVPTDSDGRFAIDSLPPGTFEAHWLCLGDFIGRQKPLGRATFTYEAGKTLEVRLSGDADGCDPRPVSERRGRMAGYYAHGFEESRFTPLDDPTVTAWAQWGRWDMAPHLREEVFSGLESGCAYVEWEGVLRGPSYYGHMRGSRYEVIVTEVYVVRPADPERCARESPVRHNDTDFR